VGRFLALDYGRRRIGLAVSDALGLTAQPLETLTWKTLPELLKSLADLVDSYQITEVVLGLPLALKGNQSRMSREVERFAQKLQAALNRPVILWDERLTSIQAKRSLRELRVKTGHYKERIDQLAAVYLLQSYLDCHSGRTNQEMEQT